MGESFDLVSSHVRTVPVPTWVKDALETGVGAQLVFSVKLATRPKTIRRHKVARKKPMTCESRLTDSIAI